MINVIHNKDKRSGHQLERSKSSPLSTLVWINYDLLIMTCLIQRDMMGNERGGPLKNVLCHDYTDIHGYIADLEENSYYIDRIVLNLA